MAGSRKGERRGGARHGQHKASFQPKTGKIRAQTLTAPANQPLESQRKRGRPKGTGGKPQLITGEREREMIEIITGRSQEMPRDVQLTVMREMMALAREYQHMMMGAMRMAPGRLPNGRAITQAEIDSTVGVAENKMTQYMMLATQVARDAAPYIHPRLSAIAVKTDRTETRDLFDVLLEEIAQQPRLHPKVIEHIAGEPVVDMGDEEEEAA